MDEVSSGIKCKLYIIVACLVLLPTKGQDDGFNDFELSLPKLFFFPVNVAHAHMVLLFFIGKPYELELDIRFRIFCLLYY